MAPPTHMDPGNQRQIPLHHQTSTDEVMVETPDIVTFFVSNRMEAHGHVVPEEFRNTNQRVNAEVANCLRQVGDDLDNNQVLNDLIGQIQVTPQTAFATFANVATQIFSDGVYNWGRVVTLLYFGYKLACSVIGQGHLLKLVLDWVVRFVKERLVDWIARQGGWVGIKGHVLSGVDILREATTTQVAAVFVMGFACFLMVWGRK